MGRPPCRLVDIVRTAVARDGALEIVLGPVGAVVLENVVLDQWIRRPPVETEVAVARGVERARVVNAPASSGFPTLATDEVPRVGPLDAVVAPGPQVHGDRPLRVGPERVEVPAVVAGLVLRDSGGGDRHGTDAEAGRRGGRDRLHISSSIDRIRIPLAGFGRLIAVRFQVGQVLRRCGGIFTSLRRISIGAIGHSYRQ